MFLSNGSNPIINSSKIYCILKEHEFVHQDNKAKIIFVIGERQVFTYWHFDTVEERDKVFEELIGILKQL